MEPLLFLGFSLFIVAIVIFVVIMGIRAEKKRTRGFINFAENTNFTFFAEGDQEIIKNLQEFQVFSKGRSKKIKNLLFRDEDNTKTFVFDYQYRTGSGKNSSTHHFSILCFQSTHLDLPGFHMRPEIFLDRIGGKFGFEDIDFPENEEFSKSYLLKGENEERIREIFDENILTYFQHQKNFFVEGNLNTLVFYRFNYRVNPEDIQEFLDRGYEIFDLFKNK